MRTDDAPSDAQALATFCRRVRERSTEHRAAMAAAARAGWNSIAVGILRQEVDSLVRAVFLLAKAKPGRADLLRQSAAGEQWHVISARTGRRRRVTDREMVDLSQRLHGWTESVYRFGCGFIHLSQNHDYHAADPLRALPSSEREWILQHIRSYHGGPATPDPSFEDVARFFPQVLEKIAENLEFYLKDIESGRSLDRP